MSDKKPKLTTKQHLFCLNILSGMKQTDAYLNAGYKPADRPTASANAYALSVNPYVVSFIEAKRKEISDKTIQSIQDSIMQPHEVKMRLSKLARANLVDFQDEGGEPRLAKDIPNNEAATEYYHRTRLDRDGNPIVSKSIKIVNPIEPLRELAKIHGMYAPMKHAVAKRVELDISYVDKRNPTPELPEGEDDVT